MTSGARIWRARGASPAATIDVTTVTSIRAALALVALLAMAAQSVAFAQQAGGEETTTQRARRAFDAETTMPARSQPRAASERGLLEQIERTRKAFESDVSGEPGAKGDEERLIEKLQSVREGLSGDAAPAAGEVAELRDRLAAQFGVEVLEVRDIETERGPAWAVKIMYPGGNSNVAFRVSTLAVDKETREVLGELSSTVRTGAGAAEAGAGLEPRTDERGLQTRRRTYR